MTSLPDPATRRNVERLASNFPGRVIIPGRHPLNCSVKDLSENGALLEFRAAIWLPPRFHLTIDAMDTEAYCEIRHQRSNRVGVAFVRVTVKDNAEPENLAAVRRTADHWEAAEHGAATAQPHVDEREQPDLHSHANVVPEPMAPPARVQRPAANPAVGATAPMPAARAVARPGSAIRNNLRISPREAPKAEPQTSLLGRLFGR